MGLVYWCSGKEKEMEVTCLLHRFARAGKEARRKGKVDRQHVRMRKIMKEISCRSIPFTHLPRAREEGNRRAKEVTLTIG